MKIRENKNIVPGDELWLFIGEWDDSKSLDQQTSAVPIAFATQHSLNRSLATTSVSSKDHGNTSYTIPGEGSWTASTESLYSVQGFNALNNLFNDSKMVYIQFGKIEENVGSGIVDKEGATPWTMGNDYLHGAGYITSLQASGGHGDSATFSAEITGVGELVSVHITPATKYDITLTNTQALQGIVTVDKNKAAEGATVTISSSNTEEYNEDNIVVSSSQVSPHDNGNGTWTFTMPAQDVTVTTQLKYKAQLTGAAPELLSNYSLNGSQGTSYFYLPGQTIEVNAEEGYGGSSYMVVTNDETIFTWDDSASYFTASMPNYYGTAYTYMAITPMAL